MDREEKWHLGEPQQAHQPEKTRLPVPIPEPPRDRAGPFLARPLYVLTVEHLSYFLISAFTVATRLLMLGGRPLSPAEAAGAMLNLSSSQAAATSNYSVPMGLVEGWLFDTLGANDFVARLGFALAGILLVALAFALRPVLGRVGALALATLIAISPTFIYFSRSTVSPVPALTLTLIVIALFFAMMKRPTFLRMAALTAASGLALAADRTACVAAAIFLIATLVFFIWGAIFDDTYFERMRYWWVRYGIRAALAIVLGIIVWLIFGGSASQVSGLLTPHPDGILAAYRDGAAFYLPFFALYEFLLALLAIAGLLLFVSFQIPSRFAGWCFIWTVAALAFYLFAPAHDAELAPAILLPMALLGALTLEYLVHSRAWRIVAYPLLLVAALTVYVALIVNFYFDAPNASEAPWARHALLYWSDPATTIQARNQARRLRNIVGRAEKGQGGGVFFNGDAPALQWYLRTLPTTTQADGAAAIVAANADSHDVTSASSGAQVTTFELQDRWTPELGDGSPSQILRYLFTQRAWSTVKTDQAAMILPAITPPSPPVTPAPTPIPAQAAIASSSPTATPSPSSSPQPEVLGGTPTPTATASAIETQAASSSPSPSYSPSETPSSISTATASAGPTATETANPATSTATPVSQTPLTTPTAMPTPTPGAIETSSVLSTSITPLVTPTGGSPESTTTPAASPTEVPEASPAVSIGHPGDKSAHDRG